MLRVENGVQADRHLTSRLERCLEQGLEHGCRYGFNPGSALAIIGYGPVVALAAINTTLAAAAGTLSALVALLVMNLITTKHVLWDLIGASNGTLGGLVAVTAGCSVVDVRISSTCCLTGGRFDTGIVAPASTV